MSYRLILAEKPSVARSIAEALEVHESKEGYLEGAEYLITWCFGHLVQLCEPEKYSAHYAKWALSDLPIVPYSFRLTVCPGKEKQYETVKTLMHREDVTEIINACDAGREGELIFRNIYILSGTNKPVKRLWISSMEKNAVLEGFQKLRPGRDYDDLYAAALCRARADWLIGINATRFFSLLYGCKLNVGRVMSAALSMLVEREAQIRGFSPEPYYTLRLNCGFLLRSERFKDAAEAQSTAAGCAGKSAVVKSVMRRERQENAPPLYDLTTLQRDANRILGYTAQQTVDYLQSLYEKRLCTYPRTDSRYLTDDMESSVSELVSAASVICGTPEPDAINRKQICNSEKVSDHHAIVLTRNVTEKDVQTLPLGEQEIMKLLAKSVVRAVLSPYRWTETEITVECEGTPFSAKGRTVIDPGWKEPQKEENTLPEVEEGQLLPVHSVEVLGGTTTPPKPFTEDTLLAAMENTGNDNGERKGIGTPATRAGILEKLIASGFLERRKLKNQTILTPTEYGISLITVLPEMLSSPQITADWEKRLQQVERGELDAEDFLSEITQELHEIIHTYTPVSYAETLFPSTKKVVGKCPRCGREVVEYPKGFFCRNRDCRFALWKESRFFTAKRKTLTDSMAAELLSTGRLHLTGCYSEKTGRTYDADILLCDNGEKMEFRMDFPNAKRTEE